MGVNSRTCVVSMEISQHCWEWAKEWFHGRIAHELMIPKGYLPTRQSACTSNIVKQAKMSQSAERRLGPRSCQRSSLDSTRAVHIDSPCLLRIKAPQVF